MTSHAIARVANRPGGESVPTSSRPFQRDPIWPGLRRVPYGTAAGSGLAHGDEAEA